MTRLVGRYERPLYRFLLHLLGDAHLAEDCFQETFLRLHRARERFDGAQRLKPYLYRIALNVARDMRRRHAAQPRAVPLSNGERGDDRPNGPSIPAPPSGDPGVPQQHADRELRGQVRAAVAALPEAEREVVVLRLFEGLTFAQVAEVAGVPVPTAKSRMLYALRRLRPVMERYLSSGADLSGEAKGSHA